MTESIFRQRVAELIKFDEEAWSTGQTFKEMYDSNVTFKQVSLYAKVSSSDIKHYNFIIAENRVKSLENCCKATNTIIGELIKLVDSPTYYPNFAAFCKPGYDVGFELNIYDVNKQKRVAESKRAYEESAIDRYVKKNGHSPCDGCQPTNCKHCEYGDDGKYSVYDVYPTSELI